MNKKRIVIFTSFLDAVGGMETWTYQFSHRLLERGNDVIVVALFDRKDFKNVKFFPFVWDERIATRCLSLPPLSPISLLDALKKIYIYKIAKKTEIIIRDILAEKDDSIILLTDPGYSLILPEYFFKKYKIYAQLHSSAKTFFEHWRNQYFYLKLVYKKFVKLIVLSDSDVKYLTNKKFDKNKLVSIYNFVETPKSGVELSNLKNKVIVSLGRLTPSKNLSGLIEIFSNLSPNHPDWQLKIYGDGEDRANVQNMITGLSLDSKIILCGNTADKYKALSEGSIFASTSLYEGFPVTILEARQCGLPVITYNCALSLSEIIKNNYDGFLIDNFDKATYQAKLELLMDDIKLRIKIGKCGRKKNEKFRPEKVMDMWNSKIFKEN